MLILQGLVDNPRDFYDAFESGQSRKCVAYRVSCRTEVSHSRTFVTARWSRQMSRNVAIRLTGWGNGFLMVDVTANGAAELSVL